MFTLQSLIIQKLYIESLLVTGVQRANNIINQHFNASCTYFVPGRKTGMHAVGRLPYRDGRARCLSSNGHGAHEKKDMQCAEVSDCAEGLKGRTNSLVYPKDAPSQQVLSFHR